MMDKNYAFFALLDRMQYINRWALMRNSRYENIKEHSFDVAIVAESLAVIHNRLVDEGHWHLAGLHGLFQAVAEAPGGGRLHVDAGAQRHKPRRLGVGEHEAAESLVSQLPDYMQDYYMSLLSPVYEGDEGYLYKRIVKAADKISAYIKCIREKLAGNTEFDSAMATLKETIDKIDLPEVRIFMDEFIPPFGLTLDELNN